MARVLVVSAEPLAELMAGPAIRARELARALAAEHHVTVAAPGPADPSLTGIAHVAAGFEDYDALAGAVGAADVVVAQRLPARLLSRLPTLGTRLIADLYNPTVFEVLEAGRDKTPGARRRQQRQVTLEAVAHLAAADRIICASEKQRDLWLGLMAGADLVDLTDYEADPTLREVIDVVPFGLPAEPPQPAPAPVIRGMFPAIAPEDRIVLWGGGVWNWLDPQTAIDAVGRLDAERTDGPRVHLVFMGLGRPALAPVDAMSAVDRILAHLGRSGLEGRVVHVNHGWVPYADRGAWLLEADLGVLTHHDHLETRFAFRTRILDCLWAGLPVVSTEGDTLADLVRSAGLGATVPAGDAPALAAALGRLAADDAARAQAARATHAVAAGLTWAQVAAPLVRLCAAGPRPGAAHHGALRRATLRRYPLIVRETHESLGAGGAVRRVARNARRALRPGG